jgi:hypothetical protein
VVSDLLDQCVYTIVEKTRLWAARRDGAPSDPITEGRRWVSGQRLLTQAKANDKQLAVLSATRPNAPTMVRA